MRRRRQPEIIAGRVASDGSVTAGDGFTVQKTGVGGYRITLAAGLRLLSATASTGATAAPLALVFTYTERSFDVGTYSTGLAGTDSGFSFTAVGAQQ